MNLYSTFGTFNRVLVMVISMTAKLISLLHMCNAGI